MLALTGFEGEIMGVQAGITTSVIDSGFEGQRKGSMWYAAMEAGRASVALSGLRLPASGREYGEGVVLEESEEVERARSGLLDAA